MPDEKLPAEGKPDPLYGDLPYFPPNPEEDTDRCFYWHFTVSIIGAVIWLALLYHRGGGYHLLMGFLLRLAPLLCIWFPHLTTY
jgi:hypothetical protein